MENKNKTLKVRIDDYTDRQLKSLEEKYQISRSEIVRRSISLFQNELVDKMFGVDILELLLPFNNAYELISFGIVDNNYLSGKGFWLTLKPNFIVGLTKGFTYGPTKVSFSNSIITVEGGFLHNIQCALGLIYDSKR